MSDFSVPIEQIRELCRETARAVVAAQENLDENMTAAVLAREEPQTNEPLYSIPQANLGLRFGMDIVNGQRSLIPFLSSDSTTRQRHSHSVAFTFTSVPKAPPRPLDVDEVEIQAFQPPFLVSRQVQDDICRQTVKAMHDKLWEFAFPAHGGPPTQPQVDAEAEKIIDAIEHEDPERGMVVFNLDAVTPAFLLIRVTDKSKKDGIFVFESSRPSPVTIYSFDGDHVDNIRYAALHQFILTLRQWLTSGAQPVPAETVAIPQDASELGLSVLDEFATSVYRGYLDSLRFLSEQRDDERILAGLPSFYDIEDVTGDLTYSVFFDKDAKRLKFSFGERKRPDGEVETDPVSLVESKALIRVFRRNDIPQVETRLIAPEFALTDQGRKKVLEAMIGAATEIVKKFDDLDPEIYLGFIRDPAFQAGVVILLSYEGTTPKPDFLVVWPGALQNKPRDFVFRCKLENGEITNIKKIMGLAQDLELDPVGVAEGVEITREQYKPFHNAFHAVRMWRSRVEMSDQ